MDQLNFVLEALELDDAFIVSPAGDEIQSEPRKALELDDAFIVSPAGDEIQSEPQKARILGRQRCIQCLVHVVRKDGNCTIPSCSCKQIKAVLAHAKVCPKKNGGCPICQPLISLCCFHAKNCVETGCTVPLCDKIKQKLQKLGQQ